jgi:hypothetical protein
MTNSPDLKARAIILRKQGLSYSEIRQQIPIAKSTLSDWLHSVGLAKHQKQRLTEKKHLGQKMGAQARKNERINRSTMIKTSAQLEVPALIKDPLWLSGVILYWAEGSKQKEWNLSAGVDFVNMDLNTHKIFVSWSKKYLNVPSENFQYDIYIHEKANIERAKIFWAKNLSISNNKMKVYFKRHNPKTKRKNISENYYGVLRISIAKSTDLNRRIAGWTEGVIEYLN